jgi:hypothetical protein
MDVEQIISDIERLERNVCRSGQATVERKRHLGCESKAR